MKSKYEKVLTKTYMSGQDEIIEGLAPHITERGETNVKMVGLKQEFQMSAPLHRYNNDISEIVNDVGDDRQPIGKNNQDTKVWAEELIRADERA
jgi:hypothetical protein